MDNIVGQAERLESEHGQDVDAIIIFVGTNDFFANVPVGEWYAFSTTDVEVSGPAVQQRRYRELIYDNSTFKGRTNIVMRWLKSHYPDKQIIFLTPLHRGYAYFRADNIQPSESYANAGGYFIDDYVAAIKELANVWAVPVIDLNSISGLYPLSDAQVKYFRNKDTDRLHPNRDSTVFSVNVSSTKPQVQSIIFRRTDVGVMILIMTPDIRPGRV